MRLIPCKLMSQYADINLQTIELMFEYANINL